MCQDKAKTSAKGTAAIGRPADHIKRRSHRNSSQHLQTTDTTATFLTLRSCHLGEKIFEEVQQVLHGVKVDEVNKLSQALHDRREQSRRGRAALQDAEIGEHHLKASTGEWSAEGSVRPRIMCPYQRTYQNSQCMHMFA